MESSASVHGGDLPLTTSASAYWRNEWRYLAGSTVLAVLQSQQNSRAQRKYENSDKPLHAALGCHLDLGTSRWRQREECLFASRYGRATKAVHVSRPNAKSKEFSTSIPSESWALSPQGNLGTSDQGAARILRLKSSPSSFPSCE